MKYTSGLLFIFIFCTSCNEQNETSLQKDSTNSETSFSGEWKSKKLSADPQTMTVNSIIHLMAVVPFSANTLKQNYFLRNRGLEVEQ